MTIHAHVKSKSDAFAFADRFFSFERDTFRSERAGYPVYSGREFYNYVCDLGDRLEVNFVDGDTLNIWF